MEDLLRFLSKNWFLLIILVPWIASVVGDVFTKAARKAAEEQRARRRAERSGSPGSAMPQPATRPNAEEVAAEIRRMMGMEVQEEQRSPSGSRTVVLEEEWEEAPESEEAAEAEAEWHEAPALPEPEQPSQEFGSLHERMAHRHAEEMSKVASRHIQPATPTGGVHDHHLQTGLMRKLQAREGSRYLRRRAARGHAMSPGEMVNFTDPVRALVMLEVFGPPKALRDESF